MFLMLSKNARIVLNTIYTEYRRRIELENMTIDNAVYFGDGASEIQKQFLKTWKIQNIEQALVELEQNGYVENFEADDTIYTTQLTAYAISKKENQRKTLIVKIFSFLTSNLKK